MSLACMQFRGLLDRRASGLSDAERLRLEEHLSACADCAGQGQLLSDLVLLARQQPDQLSAVARQRVIHGALAATGRRETRGVAETMAMPTSAMWAALGGGLAVAVALVALTWGAWRESRGDRGIARGGTVAVAPTVEVYRADRARDVRVEGAALHLDSGTELVWDAQLARVTLRRGRVRAVVASRAGTIPFSVRTLARTVVVIGTDFEVTLDSVRVHEGVVRVEDNRGVVLHAALHAGETWPRNVSTDHVSVDHEVTDDRAVRNGDVAVKDPVGRAAAEPAPPAVAAPRGMERSATQWLSAARDLLSSGDLSGARQALAQLRAVHAEPSQRAEAETLLAEAFQVEGKVARALAQYDAVARDYASLAAGDNAMFAAARLASMSGDEQAATRRFQSYLRAYPRGRFFQEATRALAKRESGRVGAPAH